MFAAEHTRVLLFQDSPQRARQLDDALRSRGVETVCHDLSQPLAKIASARAHAAVVLLNEGESEIVLARANDVLKKLRTSRVSTMIWGPPPVGPGSEQGNEEQLGSGASVDEVLGRLTMLARYGPQLVQMEREVEQLQRIGTQLQNYFDEVERDMTLAGRLQRSFLPPGPARLSRLEFDFLFRPASWVSGDIFDVFRIDESAVGVFIADVMGHGTAAGLITMFLRRALVPKQVGHNGHCIVPPVDVLTQLHNSLAAQALPGAQFVTAVYAVIDTSDLTLRLARGGHPFPLLVRPDGSIAEVQAQGGLMGVADLEPDFQEAEVQLAVGDKLVLFTDGVEDLLITPRHANTDPPAFTPELRAWAAATPGGLAKLLSQNLDSQEGSIHPPDDVTLITIGVAE